MNKQEKLNEKIKILIELLTKDKVQPEDLKVQQKNKLEVLDEKLQLQHKKTK